MKASSPLQRDVNRGASARLGGAGHDDTIQTILAVRVVTTELILTIRSRIPSRPPIFYREKAELPHRSALLDAPTS
jgi:hypothetical protein